MYAYVCALLYVLGMCAWRVCCHKVSIEEQRSSSNLTVGPGAVFQAFQALTFVPVVTVYVCGWCTA